MGFLCEARRCDSVRMIRGELAIEAYFHAANLYSVGGLGPDHDAVMRIGVGLQPTGLTRGKLRAAGQSLSRHQYQFESRLPAASDRQFGSPPKSQRECRVMLSVCSLREPPSARWT